MPENGNEETKKSGESAENQNTAPAPDDLEAIRLQLEEERQARAAAQAFLDEKDRRIAELEASLSEVMTLSETKGKELAASATELAQVREARDRAVAKYLNMARALNPAVPEGIIAGETIEEIDASVEKGKDIVEAVKKAMEAESSQARVPAGAPTRAAINLEGLSPREKIALGIQQKGGVNA